MGHPYGSVDSVGSSRCYCCHRDAIHTYVYVMNNAQIISFSNVLSIQNMKKVTVGNENPPLPSVILRPMKSTILANMAVTSCNKTIMIKIHVLIGHASCLKNKNNNKNLKFPRPITLLKMRFFFRNQFSYLTNILRDKLFFFKSESSKHFSI